METLVDILRIETGNGIVRVWHSRSAKDIEEANAILAAIDDTIEKTGLRLLLFDSRDSNRASAAVQGRIWEWLSKHPELRKVATLMHSTDRAGDVRSTGVRQGIRLRVFNDEDSARRWLVEP